ncbi:Blue-light-activated histidine kinase 1 [Paraurantiacibacter namhicola]|uniref:histidine kinase n=2 Tax=Paraurantiacibacter namhicola TaxID=645517 RepID=A0A1C7DBA2_9SPHN|nr:Blue-light-activated histidine kinase 1 [Paraurantiacibacter namhicola]
MPVAIFALVILATLLSVVAIQRSTAETERLELEARADAIASAVERRVNASTSYLRAGAALVASLDEVTPARFRDFVSELRLDADYRGSEGIGWAPVVSPAERFEFNRKIAAELPGEPQISPEMRSGADFAVPVLYLYPDTERNRRASGYDMYSEATRRAAMDEAARTVRPTASGKLVLLQDGRRPEPGFIFYMPVFSIVDGSRELDGFVYSPFNAGDFLESVLELEAAGVSEVRLYDGNPDDKDFLAGTDRVEGEGQYVSRNIEVAGQNWLLQVRAPDAAALSGPAMLTLIFGMLVASLLMLLVRMLTQQASEDEAALNFYAEQNSIRNSLTRELNHRVKNTLANVLSIMTLTRRRSSNLDEYAESLEGRIRALSATHDLLTKSDWGSTPIANVVAAETAPYAKSEEGTVMASGPLTELAPNDALSLGLALHELATNAAKYGALSQHGGRVEVAWEPVAEDRAKLVWQESNGPAVPQSRQRGFGLDLIEKIVAHELGSPVTIEFDPAGVRCEMVIPVRQGSDFRLRSAHRDI